MSPETDCVFTDVRLFGDSVGTWRYSADKSLREMLIAQWIPGSGTLMRGKVWERVHGYCEERSLIGNEDWDFWIAALAVADLNVVHVPQALYRYRRHADSVSSRSLRDIEYLQREQLYRRHATHYDRYGIGGYFRAVGYLNSATFSWRLGHKRRAASIVGAALRRRGVARPFVTLTTRTAVDRGRSMIGSLMTGSSDS